MKLPLYRPDPANATRYLFFTGKGGVGTSLSCERLIGPMRGLLREAVKRLLERLRAPAFTRILLVTLPEAVPVHEAAALQKDLSRAHIEPFAWVNKQSLLHSELCDPLLQRREESEHRYLREVVGKQSARTAWLPWQAEDPVGPDALVRLGSAGLHSTSPS